jgi:hypothetical protein
VRLPGPVRAHAARPLAWLAAGIVLAALVTASRVGDARADRRDAEAALRVDGRVADGPRRGADIPVVYRNPVTGQRIEVEVATRSAGGGLRNGDRVALEVDPDDPDGVTLAGDRLPWFDPLAGPPFVLLGLAVCLARWWSVHRTVRMARSGGGVFAMLGAVAPARPRHRRAVLHLYPLDAPAGAPSACAVRVLTTGGCPVAGPAFPVEVKGVPRPLGRVVARVGRGDAVLWPAARASLHGALPRPGTVVAPLAPPPVDRAELPAWVAAGGPYPPRTRFADLARPLAGALAVAFALGAVVTGTTLTNAAAARQEAEGRQQGVAEVVDRHGSGVTQGPRVELELASGDGDRTVTAPVAHPRDYTIGRRYPVLVDPGADRPVLLARERYDATGPIVMAWIPAVVVAVEAVRRLLAWRRSGRLARAGPWSRLDVWSGAGGAMLFGDRRDGYLRAALGTHPVDGWLSRRAAADAPGAPAVRDARGVVVAGRPEPGGTVAVVDDEGGVYVVARRLEVPAGPPAPGRLVEAVRRAVARFTGSAGPAPGGATPGAGVPP